MPIGAEQQIQRPRFIGHIGRVAVIRTHAEGDHAVHAFIEIGLTGQRLVLPGQIRLVQHPFKQIVSAGRASGLGRDDAADAIIISCLICCRNRGLQRGTVFLRGLSKIRVLRGGQRGVAGCRIVRLCFRTR